MTKASQLREMSIEDLRRLADEKGEELMQTRMRLKMRQIDNPLQIRMARRELARIRTLINEKQRESAAR